jgi:ribosomal protein S18 acetylase RimI-like enzyme
MRRYQADVAPRDQKREGSSMSFTIRLLREDEAALYRDIRLEGLRLHPESFGAAFEQESLEPLEFFAARLAGGGVFGGFRDGALLGVAGFMRETGLKRAHKAHLWGMYVRSAARGTGLARMIVEAVLDHARGRVELVQLSVTDNNAVARRLYESLGFVAYGIEPRALKVDGRNFDEFHMVKLLD